MNTRKNINIPKEISKHFSFLKTLILYLVICDLGIGLLLVSFNSLIRKNNQKLMSDVCSLVTEKLESSISHMTGLAENMAAMLSAQAPDDLQALYGQLLQNDGGSEYVSLGLIDEEGRIYATPTEQSEFEKWGLLETARLADPVSVSAPYRSGKTGQPVFTMFVDFTYGEGSRGYLFLTYPLEEIQRMAYTEVLTDDVEIWLMEAASDNIIQCAGPNPYSIGVWDNAKILFGELIHSGYGEDYAAWKDKMDAGEAAAGLTYRLGGESYTQVYSRIDCMHGWYVVVRIPSVSLSTAIQQFRVRVAVFVGFLLIVTVGLFLVSHRREAREKKVLENLSIQDPLTSALNRRAFDFTADQYLGYLGKTLKNEASLLFIDVDNFKHVNDRFGHEAGDRILTGFASALREIFGEEPAGAAPEEGGRGPALRRRGGVRRLCPHVQLRRGGVSEGCGRSEEPGGAGRQRPVPGEGERKKRV